MIRGQDSVRKAVSAVGGVTVTGEGFRRATERWWKVKKCLSAVWSLSERAFPVTQYWCGVFFVLFLRKCLISERSRKPLEDFYFMALKLLLFYWTSFRWCHERWNKWFYIKNQEGQKRLVILSSRLKWSTVCMLCFKCCCYINVPLSDVQPQVCMCFQWHRWAKPCRGDMKPLMKMVFQFLKQGCIRLRAHY